MPNPLSATPWNRREFVGAAATAFLTGLAITVVGCGEDEPTAPAGGSGDIAGSISGNHGHIAVITKAQLDASGGVTLDIAASAGHAHTVTLTADQIATIKTGTHVEVVSTATNSHTHTVGFHKA